VIPGDPKEDDPTGEIVELITPLGNIPADPEEDDATLCETPGVILENPLCDIAADPRDDKPLCANAGIVLETPICDEPTTDDPL